MILSFTVWGYWIIVSPQDNLFIRLYDHYFSNTWCKNFEINDNLSCGEESLFTQEKFSDFHPGNWQKAVDYFTQKRNENKENQNKPEFLIYLNNAELMQQEKINGKKSYTIAIFVPINRDRQDRAESLLRGVAQVQEEFNENPQHPGLKILIVNDANDSNDSNDSRTVHQLAERLLSKKDVVAVIGHYTSELTKEALPVYQKNKVVVMSPATALREAILNGQQFPENFLFLTNPSVRLQTPILIQQLQLSNLANGEKVAVFYNENSTFSKSAFEEFRNQLGANKIIERDISISNFIPSKILTEVKKEGAKVLILLPDGGINPNSLNNTLRLIDENQDQLPIGGQGVLYNERILNKKLSNRKLSIVITWHRLTSPNPKVIEQAINLWGTGMIDDGTAMSYDATLVLTKALENVSINNSLQKQRLDIQQQLTNLQVKEGASGTISFDDYGDRKENISQIVRVVSVPPKCSEYEVMFVPINYNLSNLKCLEDENLSK
ncbi:ABC transporter substrate-binding protein [Anabaena sp. UHCC 0451]|uniref:ABC transporter substrate-binding protein n=1 Tax=Anabaena sp. UHCC 0451 TaxID=2055235 RepID=UPI002B1F3211|nr:ABC transporter substrate-binding protein [Anabaena sp. UHCC 0451]MEA5576737.1 ABC transporter substrate-binding protein [Anabaena sp. UHCC 0451]